MPGENLDLSSRGGQSEPIPRESAVRPSNGDGLSGSTFNAAECTAVCM